MSEWMNNLHESVPASSPSNDQLVGSLGRAGNTRRKGCLEFLPLQSKNVNLALDLEISQAATKCIINKLRMCGVK